VCVNLDLHPHMHATGRGSWQPTRPLAPGEMHGPELALTISARFAASHEPLRGPKRSTFVLQQLVRYMRLRRTKSGRGSCVAHDPPPIGRNHQRRSR